MEMRKEKRTAKVRLTLTKRTVEGLEPTAKPWIAWDNKLTGFGVRIQPSGTKSFLVNYRANGGGRHAANKRVVIGRFGRITPDQARRQAQELLGRVAAGDDPAGERARARGLPTLQEAFEDYLEANPSRAPVTVYIYRQNLRVNLSDWANRPVDAISRKDVEARFNHLTEEHGWSAANQTISMLRSIYRRPCVDHDKLRNPVELWLAGGGKFHRKRRRRISAPGEVLPRWRTGIEAVRMPAAARDILWVGVYTGMRLGEITSLRWERVDLKHRILRVDETKSGEVLKLPITQQLAAIFERRCTDCGDAENPPSGWVFPSAASKSGHMLDVQRFHAGISRAGGTKFWFHGLRNSFISVAERELLLPRSLTKRLVNHARSDDVTEGYAADWTVEQLREPAQRTADRIDELMDAG